MTEFRIKERHQGNIVILDCSGELDYSTFNHGDDTVKRLLERGNRIIIFNLNEVKYISSSGWTVFLGNLKQARAGGGDIFLAGMQKEVKASFTLLELDNLIDCYETAEEAVKNAERKNG